MATMEMYYKVIVGIDSRGEYHFYYNDDVLYFIYVLLETKCLSGKKL